MAIHLSQLQEQMQAAYEGLVEKMAAYHPPPPPPPTAPWLGPPPSLGYLQYMNPTSQWHQHQLLISSLNQCCQLIWHQQREIAGLRQALNMVQRGEERVCEEGCQGYGHNLNPGLLWQPPLNNQVPPGNRANNYWDNFRSYSRQNLLSARNKSNERGRPASASASASDNLRRVENSCSSNSRTPRNGENLCDPNYFGPRDVGSNKVKHDRAAKEGVCLEECVYSELECVLSEPDRSPDLLLLLLSQHRSCKSRPPPRPQETGGMFEEAVGLDDGATPGCSRQSNPVQLKPTISLSSDDSKGCVLEEVGKLVSGGGGHQVCTPDLLQRLVELASRALPHDQAGQTSLEASLLKFQGARLAQVAEELLCTVGSALSLHYPTDTTHHHQLQVELDEGRGAVAPLLHAQVAQPASSPQSVETELAEADQRSSSDNAVGFDSHEVESYNDDVESQELNHGREEGGAGSECSSQEAPDRPKD